ncbi:MAG: phosphotransferase [Pseudomonadales bacterium]|nr:phosphotransferase [Pseudomonadales bacterium]
MSDHFITGTEDLTPDRLSSLLDIDVRQLRVERTGETTSGGHAHCQINNDKRFIKWTRPEAYTPRKARANQREVWFYRNLGTFDMHACRCIAAYANDEGASTIILEDISATHTPWTPALPDWEPKCVDALAALHSRFWNDPRLDALLPETEALDAWRARMHHRVEGMARELALADSSELHELVDLPIWAKWFERAETQPLTIQHGDAHSRNFLFTDNEAVLIDWELLGAGVPVMDLMHLLVFDAFAKIDELVPRYLSQTPYETSEFESDWHMALLLAPLLASAFWQNGLRAHRLKERFDFAMAAKHRAETVTRG